MKGGNSKRELKCYGRRQRDVYMTDSCVISSQTNRGCRTSKSRDRQSKGSVGTPKCSESPTSVVVVSASVVVVLASVVVVPPSVVVVLPSVVVVLSSAVVALLV